MHEKGGETDEPNRSIWLETVFDTFWLKERICIGNRLMLFLYPVQNFLTSSESLVNKCKR